MNGPTKQNVFSCYRGGYGLHPWENGDDVTPQEFFFRASVLLIGGYKATQLRCISNEKYATVVARNGLGECSSMISVPNFRFTTTEISEHNTSREITFSSKKRLGNVWLSIVYMGL